MAAELFDKGIDDCAAPAGVFAANEHPVLVSELGGADGVFREVVVKFDLAVGEAGFEVGPLVRGIVEGGAQAAGGRDAAPALKPFDEFCEVIVIATGL